MLRLMPIGFNVEKNDKDPNFKVGDHDVKISKYKNIFWIGYTSNWSEEFFCRQKC